MPDEFTSAAFHPVLTLDNYLLFTGSQVPEVDSPIWAAGENLQPHVENLFKEILAEIFKVKIRQLLKIE
jgi:hypothetical protein